MGDQVARRHLLGGNRVVHLEGWHVLADGLVAIQLTLVHKYPHRCGRKGLGAGTDGKCGVFGHRQATANVLQAMPFGIDGSPVLDDADRQAGHVPALHGSGDEPIESLELRAEVAGRFPPGHVDLFQQTPSGSVQPMRA